jgi:hypothetical protein
MASIACKKLRQSHDPQVSTPRPRQDNLCSQPLAYPHVFRKVCPLHEYEVKNVVLETAVSTITWFDGDGATAASHIRARVKEILCLNPWLAGRLVMEPTLSLVFQQSTDPIQDSVVDTIFSFHEHHPGFTLRTPLSDLADTALAHGFICPKASDILRKKLPFFKVTMVADETGHNKRFALIVSLAHRVGDGHTFYSIYNMLSESTPLRALDPVRKMHVFDEIEKVTRKKLLDSSAGFWLPLRIILSTLRARWMNRKTRFVTFLIDHEFLNRCKIDAKSNKAPSLVSSNDIITSASFKITHCDVGFMAVNFRERVNNSASTDAGNYITVLKYASDDYETPVMIRKSIQGPYYGSSSSTSLKTLTGPSNVLQQVRWTLCSNWSGFVVDEFVLQGSKQLVHLPLRVLSHYSGSSFLTYCIIFQPWRDQLAMLICGDSNIVSKFESSELFMKPGSSEWY